MFSEGRKRGGRVLIQTESAYRPTLLPNFLISLFLRFSFTFEADLKRLLMLLKCLKTLFCLKYTQKLPKNSNLLQSVRMIMGVLLPPPTTVQCSIPQEKH